MNSERNCIRSQLWIIHCIAQEIILLETSKTIIIALYIYNSHSGGGGVGVGTGLQ